MVVENTSKQTNQAQIIPENQPAQNIINNQRGNVPIIIGVLLLLLIIGGGAYYFGTQNNQAANQTSLQPTPTVPDGSPSVAPIISSDAASEWKTLTNTKSGYSFKYPSDKYNETIYTTEPFLYAVQYCPSKKPEDCAFPSNVFQVIAYDNPQNTNIENWLKTNANSPIYEQGKMNCYLNDTRTIKSPEKFLGQEVTTYRFTIDQDTAKGVCKGQPLEGGGEYKYIFAQKGNNIYWISISLASKEVYPELEKILSTFQFTN